MVNEAGGQYESQQAAITSLEWREDRHSIRLVL